MPNESPIQKARDALHFATLLAGQNGEKFARRPRESLKWMKTNSVVPVFRQQRSSNLARIDHERLDVYQLELKFLPTRLCADSPIRGQNGIVTP